MVGWRAAEPTFLLTLLQISLWSIAPAAAQPQNGDIRLADGIDIGLVVIGRLEVYNSSTGGWGTVCYNETLEWGEKGAARAACRQLGTFDMANVGTVVEFGIPEAPASTPIVLYQLNCPYTNESVFDYDLNNAPEHILRCSLEQRGSCTHKQDMAIGCNSILKKYYDSYSAEVRLSKGGTGFPSSGVLEVYLNDHWETVCADNMDSANADSACRQMGYTGSSGHSSVNWNSLHHHVPALDNLTCTIPHPCFSGCFKYPQSTDTVNCSSGQIATINCTFDLSVKSFTAGSKRLCASSAPVPPPSPSPVDPNTLIKAAEILGGVVGAIIAVAIAIIVVLLCCCFISSCPLHSYRQKQLHGLHGYDQIQTV